MPTQTRIFLITKLDLRLKDKDGIIFLVPLGWENLPAGDASVTRKLKSLAPTWAVQEKKGKKIFSHGVWAATEYIQAAQALVALQRADPVNLNKLAQAKIRRDKNEAVFGEDFLQAIVQFLNFDPKYQSVMDKVAALIKEHAAPVGSGTVARSASVTIGDKASLAVMAWMRHQISHYDSIPVARVKGARRLLRRKIAQQSQCILAKYRNGSDIDVNACPLYKALQKAKK